MSTSWQEAVMYFFRTFSQILTAGIAITAFSLLLYALTFNLRDRVARSFATILGCLVVVFTAEALGGNSAVREEVEVWMRVEWIGLIFLPAAYLHFSDALLATTGKPSRWRRFLAVRMAYVISVVFTALLALGLLLGPVVMDPLTSPHLTPNLSIGLFFLFYTGSMGAAWINFIRAYRRTTTATSRRRMGYLVLGALGPAIGSFPFLLFGSNVASNHPLVFWLLATSSNMIFLAFTVIMAYAVAFFGVTWPDRVVKSRLFKWLLRGPGMASIVLGLVTIVRRVSEDLFGNSYSALVPITMVATVVMVQYMITLLSPWWERVLFFGNKDDMLQLRRLEDHLVTRSDIRQFLEMLLAAVCDRLQASGAYVAAMNGAGLDLVVSTGNNDNDELTGQLEALDLAEAGMEGLFEWGEDVLVPLITGDEEDSPHLLGVLGITGIRDRQLDDEELQALALLAQRATMILRDHHLQKQFFASLQTLATDIDYLQRVRAAARYDGATLLMEEAPQVEPDLSQWVKEALTHYWGGPKLTQSPLIRLRVVQEALEMHEGNSANALRSILKKAIESTRPEGERRFTGEWILYNILELKFLEGRKVREVAMRLAMSEADLYRKQRVAIEAVASAIHEMETEARGQTASESGADQI